jgi:hypothetical protein
MFAPFGNQANRVFSGKNNFKSLNFSLFQYLKMEYKKMSVTTDFLNFKT